VAVVCSVRERLNRGRSNLPNRMDPTTLDSSSEAASKRSSRTGLVWHELFMWHDTTALAGMLRSGRGVLEPDEPTESPATKRRIKNLLDVAGITERLVCVKPRPATQEELAAVHDRGYIAALERMSEELGGDAQMQSSLGDAPFGPGGFDIARLAAGGVLAAVDAVMAGTVENAYALVRPPGHHAEAGHGLGFCVFNNGAVAARHAQRAHGLRRIAIVDWDAHHGNGAQHIFWTDPCVLTISIHQDGAFPPGSGPITDIGEGDGTGYNLNIPLPAGSGAGAYLAAFERVIVPALERFIPDLIIVPCGFDAGCFDPMSRMMLHGDCFRAMAGMVQAAADQLCGGRLVLCHEGGYHRTSVPFFGMAVIEQLAGIESGMADPFQRIIESYPCQDLQPHQDTVLRQAERLVERL
jgi:acetoin utilization deacetylase AcuC-like enzyme